MKKSAKQAGPVIVPIPPTIIEFLLDETQSMSRFLEQTLAGYQDFVDDQRKQGGTCLFTLTKFDTRGLRTPYLDLDIGMVPYLSATTYLPTASTNLYDAIAERIAARREQLTTWDIVPRVLFVCMTDGEDNSSRRSETAVRDDILQASADEWTFVYLGAYPRSDVVAQRLGFRPDNIRCFQGAQMATTMQELSEATRAYRASATTKQDFYTSI